MKWLLCCLWKGDKTRPMFSYTVFLSWNTHSHLIVTSISSDLFPPGPSMGLRCVSPVSTCDWISLLQAAGLASTVKMQLINMWLKCMPPPLLKQFEWLGLYLCWKSICWGYVLRSDHSTHLQVGQGMQDDHILFVAKSLQYVLTAVEECPKAAHLFKMHLATATVPGLF